MTVEKLKEKKQDLEADIEQLVNKFQKETGLVVDRISMNQVNALTFDENGPGSKFISNIETEVKLP